jgi:hypothetical protein
MYDEVTPHDVWRLFVGCRCLWDNDNMCIGVKGRYPERLRVSSVKWTRTFKPMRTILWCWRSLHEIDVNLWRNGLVWVICTCSFVVIIVIVSALSYLATYPVLHGWDGNTARCSCRVVLVRITAVMYVVWELPDKFRGKGGRWSVGNLDRRWSSTLSMGVALTLSLPKQKADVNASR